jgi:hypothetical protein
MTHEEHMQEAYYDYCDNEERAGHIGAPFDVWKAAELKRRALANPAHPRIKLEGRIGGWTR